MAKLQIIPVKHFCSSASEEYCSLFTIFITAAVLNGREPSEMGFPVVVLLLIPQQYPVLLRRQPNLCTVATVELITMWKHNFHVIELL